MPVDDGPEVVLESDVASSDLDLDDNKPGKGKFKRLKKRKVSRESDEEKRLDDGEAEELLEEDYYYNENSYKESDLEDERYRRTDFFIDKTYKERHGIENKIFNDERQKRKNKEEKKLNREDLKMLYDPDELEEEYCNEKDENIVQKDMPERLQLQYPDNNLDEYVNEIENESAWVIDKIRPPMFKINNPDTYRIIKTKIARVLEIFKKDHYDIPYIVLYKRIEYEPELTSKDVWRIFELDKEWVKLFKMRKETKKSFEKVAKYIEDPNIRHNYEFRFVHIASSIRELKDTEIFIQFLRAFYHNDNEEFDDIILEDSNSPRPPKPPNRFTFIDTFKKSKLIDLARIGTITSYQMAMNIEFTGEYKMDKMIFPDEPNEKIEEVSFRYIDSVYAEQIKVLTSTCKFLALELAAHPQIRNFVRSLYFNSATISTSPTTAGIVELDAFHPSYRTKRIYKRPIETFQNDLFIDVVENEKKRLIEVSFNLDDDKLNFISEKLKMAYIRPKVQSNQSNQSNSSVEKENEILKGWNQFREEVIQKLLFEVLLPELRADLRSFLLENAENYVLSECARNYSNLLMTGPYRRKVNNLYEDATPVVMSFVYDNVQRITYCVIVDSNGEVKEQTKFNFINQKPSKYLNKTDKDLFNDERNRIIDLIKLHQPQLIVIGANDLECRNIKEKISQIDQELSGTSEGTSWITYGDLTIPRIISSSTYSEKRLKSYCNQVRQGVSMARMKQNPMAEILVLWNDVLSKNTLLSIPLHPFQRYINQARLKDVLETESVKAVNSVGIDINKAIICENLRAPMNFISGFGPRKANNLFIQLKKYKQILMRLQLLTCKLIKQKIFIGCCGFLLVKTDDNSEMDEERNNDNNLIADPLDTTRIHNDMYSKARAIAKYVCDGEINKSDSQIEAILQDPRRLNNFDIIEFQKKYEEKGSNNINNHPITIRFIIEELQNPFKDPRPEHIDLSTDEIFYLLVNETKSTFDEGHFVVAKVVRIDEQHVKCKLSNDLDATLWIKDIFDENSKEGLRLDKLDKEKLKEKFPEGMSFQARIKQINRMKFKVDLTAKNSDLSNHKKWIQISELYNHFRPVESEDFENQAFNKIKNEEKVAKYTHRNINHPSYKNFSYISCIEYLSDKKVGDYVFRSSSRGSNHLTLSWKFYDHVYSHLDILEENKVPGASMGSRLMLKGESYASIKEIIDRFITPCFKLVKEVLANRKFVHCDNVPALDEILHEQKSKDNTIIHYLVTILKEFPQFIVLGYISKHVTKEYIEVKPKGFYFHEEYFSSLDTLFTWFKKNMSLELYKTYVKKKPVPALVLNQPKEEKRDDYSVNNDYFENSSNRSPSLRTPSHRSPSRNYRSDLSERLDSKRLENSKTCYYCGEIGHLKIKCPRMESNNIKKYSESRRSYGSSGSNKGGNYDKNYDNDDYKYTGNKRERDDTGNDNSWKPERREEKVSNWGDVPYVKANNFSNLLTDVKTNNFKIEEVKNNQSNFSNQSNNNNSSYQSNQNNNNLNNQNNNNLNNNLNTKVEDDDDGWK